MKNVTIRHTITSNIERLMSAGGRTLTEAELAARSGIPESTLRAILCGTVDVDVDTLDAIAKALFVNTDALLATSLDPVAQYRDQIAALPADQQQLIQDFIDSVLAQHEEQRVG